MNVTLYSFIMAVFLSTAFVGFTHLFRRKEFFLRSFGIPMMLFLYGVCVFRMMLPLEFPFTRPIEFQREHNDFLQMIRREGIFPVASGISILELALGIWIMGSLVTLVIFLVKYLGPIRKVRKLESVFPVGETAESLLKQIQEESPRRLDTRICICPGLEIPMGVGVFRKRILLPYNTYTEKELYYILKHEYTHFCNHDLTVKMLVSLFCCVFWWNPAVYFLQNDLGEMLEMKCDAVCTRNFSREQKSEYLHLLTKLVEDAPEDKGKRSRRKKRGPFSKTSAPFFEYENSLSMQERFHLIANPVQKGKLLGQVLVVGIFSLLFVASYVFVVQPYYDPPTEDIYTSNVITGFDSNNGYILKHSDGSYSMVINGNEPVPIKEDNVKMLIEAGYEVKEEFAW